MAQYKDIIIPSGSIFNNATIKGFGNVVFKDTPQNQFDIGIRNAKNGEYKILSIVDKSKEDNAPFAQPITISGFPVKIGTVVNIRLTKNITNSIPNELIIMTGNTPSNTGANTNTSNTTKTFNGSKKGIIGGSNPTTQKTTDNTTTKSIFTPKNIIIGVLAITTIFGLLKWQKVI